MHTNYDLEKKEVGHYNPKATYVYWTIWLCIAVLVSSGHLVESDYFFGDPVLENVHSYTANFLIFLVAIHLIGTFFDAYQNKRKTWMLMISGKKE